MNTKITSLLEAQAEMEEALAKLAEVRGYVREQTRSMQDGIEARVNRRDAHLWAQLSVWYARLTDAIHSIDPRYDEPPVQRLRFRLIEPDE
jgi:hypothetical protein